MARKRKLAAAVFSLGCLHAGSLMALGLGEITIESYLNEPLKASVDLLNLDGLHQDQIRIRLATSEDFDKLGLERAYFLTNIQFSVVADESGGARIVISSEKPVLEPYLDFVVEARWPSGRLLREYTVLVDPPVHSQSPSVSASQRVEEVEGIPPSASTPAPAKKNEEVGLFTSGTQRSDTVSSGTTVDVRRTDLAPGAMPQRDYSASTSTAPVAGARYMIGRDQTLWDIANRAKPAGVSVHQEMLEIQRLNPDAFINGNINRIKAGYIIYLPSAADISSTDEPTALAAVREQNTAWREGRDAELYASGGPSLRISAEPEDAEVESISDTGATATGTDAPMADVQASPGSVSTQSDAAAVPPANASEQERLAAIEEQLDTLKRIVSLKDDQIAALQNALAEAGVDSAEAVAGETVAGEAPAGSDEEIEKTQGEDELIVPVPLEESGEVSGEQELAAETAEQPGQEIEPELQELTEPEKQEASTVTPAPTPPAAPASASESGWSSYLLYILGALVLGIVGFVFARRGREEGEDAESASYQTPVADVFSAVKLKQQGIEVEAPDSKAQGEEQDPSSARNNRGYGQRKHDQYASDVDASDALAEAEIYIAYGRHPQAIDLLKNALIAEPSNPVYRLKLLEIYNELKDYSAANSELSKIRAGGDPGSIARAETLMSAAAAEKEQERPAETAQPAAREVSRLSPNPLELTPGRGETLESDFSGLEIEDPSASGVDEEELDLSNDFEVGHASNSEDEELVIADDSNGLSTKLDLARAYLDMGDDDGARQILDEVIMEGNDQLKAEARALLDRIGG